MPELKSVENSLFTAEHHHARRSIKAEFPRNGQFFHYAPILHGKSLTPSANSRF
jgi:hypothetical protein